MPPRGPYAVTERTVHHVRTEQPELNPLKVISSFLSPDFPNQPMDCYQIIEEDEASLEDAVPTNLLPQTN
jgi:hypothetical protein